MIFDKYHPLYELFIKFHSGQLDKKERTEAKILLFNIHYGTWDLRAAFAEAQKILDTQNSKQH